MRFVGMPEIISALKASRNFSDGTQGCVPSQSLRHSALGLDSPRLQRSRRPRPMGVRWHSARAHRGASIGRTRVGSGTEHPARIRSGVTDTERLQHDAPRHDRIVREGGSAAAERRSSRSDGRALSGEFIRQRSTEGPVHLPGLRCFSVASNRWREEPL